jgi:DNA/RNA-binding domain of Phe-tRNA-synthetase-like protein
MEGTHDMPTIIFDQEIRQLIPETRLGVLQASHVTNESYNPGLWSMMIELQESVRHQWQGKSAVEHPTIAATRRAYRALKDDPTRYRPSNEALLRRVMSHRALPQVNVVVDINTYVSLQSGWPLGCYDLAAVGETITLRRGQPGETYAPIGKPEVDAANRLVLADEHGIFGSPTADSSRTMVTLETHDLLVIIFAFEVPSTIVEDALAQSARLLSRFCGATIVEQQVLGV